MLSDEQRTQIEQRLLRERELAREALDHFQQQHRESLEDRTGELSSFRFHPADLGTEAMEQEKAFLLASQEGRRLYETDEALRRLYNDPEGFDRCEHCGETIPFERLDILPTARTCARCQAELEAV